MLDGEPTFQPNESRIPVLWAAMYWYGEHGTKKDAAEILGVSQKIAEDFMQLAWLTRIKERGFMLPANVIAHMNETRKTLEKNKRKTKKAT